MRTTLTYSTQKSKIGKTMKIVSSNKKNFGICSILLEMLDQNIIGLEKKSEISHLAIHS